jgi:hypothetical protein
MTQLDEFTLGLLTNDEVLDVNQDTPQTVTARYADGRIEGDICSAGKGTCCVEPGARGGPTPGQMTVDQSNWTPHQTRKRVERKFETHPKSGIAWWTEFNGARHIALHEYAPVDGTPLSHGCVRLHAGIAKRINRGTRIGHTVVNVTGTPRPRCDHGPLLEEWQKDFRNVSSDDGEVSRDVRQHLKVAYGGASDAELARRVAARDIPRCGRRP